MRLVSLTCSNTEIVAALGAGDLLVGIDDHSDFPEALCDRLPRLGPDLSIDVEAVRRLEPDLVLASLTVPGHERVVEAVDQAGLSWIAPDPQSFDDVLGDVRTIGGLIGREAEAEALVARMEAETPPVEVAGERPAVLVEWWPKPVIAPGRRSWVTDLLWRAGGRNPLGDRSVRSTPLTDEEVVALAPDAVVVSWCGVPTARYRLDVVTRRAAWSQVPAIRHGRVHPVAEAFLGRPGPRLVDGYRALRAVIEAATR
ncbi:MAG: ABC transporter substrate-binding protein [Alphaproteobacteria bacterium]|nr:ABC transporter substrate-binding protein [Alphaproteobacteria bacterium]MCB9698140.1 ABC transporter substrate-binding protein [Alphaproteobacteria bacterium]